RTRAESSDVANAIIDGTDAIVLSGESALGAYPVQAVEMMARIAAEVESAIEFKSYHPDGEPQGQAVTRAANALAQAIQPKCIVAFTATGRTALNLAAERLRAPVVALTADTRIYHALNLVWGIRPLVIQETPDTVESLVDLAISTIQSRGMVDAGDAVVVLGTIPGGDVQGTNFIKVHALPS